MTQHHNLINGQWTAADSYCPNTNPSDLSDVIGEYAQGGAEDVQAAVAAAAAAFPVWSTSGIQARSDALDKIGTEILARKAEPRRAAGPRRRQDPARSHWRSRPRRPDLQVLCR